MKRKTLSYLLRVDPVRCDGFGHCAELAPELITLDEWGYPILSGETFARSHVELVQSARLAVRGCPRAALSLQSLSSSESN
ncbi:MAG: ferredoxin [Acidobacteria bacterium]|nr:ferredoxin [Acidobacteriota bacterium]